MARNIEIKARAQHFEQLRERAAQLAPDTPLIFRQQDFSTTCRAGASSCASSTTARPQN